METSLIIARETGAKVFANDLWMSAEENGKRFAKWGIGGQVTPVCEDANHLPFEKKQFRAMVSIDSYVRRNGKRLSLVATESRRWNHGKWIVLTRHGRTGLQQIINMLLRTDGTLRRLLNLIPVLWGFMSV